MLEESGQASFEVFRPEVLGQDGRQHPIVTWGNGTAAQPHQYLGVLHQLASWGLVVVASTSRRTGKGHQMLEGVHHLLACHADRTSPLFELLHVDRVAAVGHSQGAGGSVNATSHSDGVITVTVPICLPNERWVSKGDEYDVTQLRSATLFLGGSRDRLIASADTLSGYFHRTPAPAAVGVLRGAGHNVIQKSGGRYLGYLTAWLMAQLLDDQRAAAAFAVDGGEFLRHPAWRAQAVK